MTTTRAITGFQDILPERAELFWRLETAAREVFRRYGFREVRLPEMEYTELFARGIGQTTDIVEKEMFTLADSKGRAMSLRPEGTAGVVRAYIENGQHATAPQARWFYGGAMFRHERPQKGRFRQFHQIGVEAFGSEDPMLDAEIIALLMDIFASVNVAGTLEINSIGDLESRAAYKQSLVKYFGVREAELCDDCKRRLRTNPMRILDCKNPTDRQIAYDAPSILDHLNDASAEHFARVKAYLDAAGVAYAVNPRIVRGLDYYTRTAFEVTTDRLGAQNAIAGGGRYDGLVEALGGPAIAGIGFAIGIERVVELMSMEARGATNDADVMLVPMGEAARVAAFRLARRLREEGVSCLVGLDGRGPKAQLKRADRAGCRFALVIGDNELAGGAIEVKDLGDERTAAPDVNAVRLAKAFAETVAEGKKA
ncbi:histidine--tRNA ligase [bacterium]|nr:histidine--tRNA ligase [bacterium]